MDYLKGKEYYIDLYDLHTIKDSLRSIEFWRKKYKESKTTRSESSEDLRKAFQYCLNWDLYTRQGQRYRHKAKRIQELMGEAKQKQDFYDNTFAPSDINCHKCGKHLSSETKILEDYMDTPMRVLFYFPCEICKLKRAIYNTGEEFQSKPMLCPKCKSEIKETHTIKGEAEAKIIIWKKKCHSCNFEEEIIDDFAKNRAKWKKAEADDRQLLDKYREEFCLSEEKGSEYIELIKAMEVANVVREEEMQKYDSSVYQRSLQLKKTTIADVEKLLTQSLEKAKYTKLSFDKPEIGQFVIVPFIVQDSDSSRKDRISVSELEKLVKDAVENTNWRLLSNSIIYRLGYLEGRLKGYEQEEDMLKLAGKKEEPKPKPKIDEEKRQKYASNNLVQLAKLVGEHEGIENMRKRRLNKEPDGFFLEASEGPLTCGICGESTLGNKTWWDLNGIRCADCQRNLEEGVITPEMCKDVALWMKEFRFQYDYGLHPATRRKLSKQGVIKGRDLKREDGTTYCTIYLVEENQEFFKRYPKKSGTKIDWKMKSDI